MHRRISGAHLCQHSFGRDAAIHQPDAACLAIQTLDAGQEVAQCPAVTGVAGQHLVGDR